MPQPKHAADPPGGPCPCHPDRSSRMWRSDAERAEIVWRPVGGIGRVLQRGGLPVGLVPAAARAGRVTHQGAAEMSVATAPSPVGGPEPVAANSAAQPRVPYWPGLQRLTCPPTAPAVAPTAQQQHQQRPHAGRLPTKTQVKPMIWGYCRKPSAEPAGVRPMMCEVLLPPAAAGPGDSPAQARAAAAWEHMRRPAFRVGEQPGNTARRGRARDRATRRTAGSAASCANGG
jgi:hypothetical protein